MRINTIVREVADVAKEYNLRFIETDRTDNIVSLKLLIDNDLFIQIYGNQPNNFFRKNFKTIFRVADMPREKPFKSLM